MEGNDFYKDTDLTNLPPETVREFLNYIRIGNGQKYYKHLCVMLPLAARIQTAERKASGTANGHEFIEKVSLLLGHLNSTHTRYYAFHALTRVASSVFRPELRVFHAHSNFAVEQANNNLLSNMQDLLDGEAKDRSRIQWAKGSSSPYWNFAAANRKLLSAWKRQCNGPWNSHDHPNRKPEGEERTGKCWHRQSLPLIEFVMKRAWSEVRATIMLTVGTQLPPELTEAVFNFALVVEEVPPNASLFDIEVVEGPLEEGDFLDGGGDAVRTVKTLRGWEYCGSERYAE